MTTAQAPIKTLSEDEEMYVEAEGKLFELYKHRSTNIAQSQALEREKRMATLTFVELDKLPSDTITYKAVGRSFITRKQDVLKGDIRNNIEYCDVELKKLQETRISIQKRIEAEEESFKTIIQKIQLSKQQPKSN
ncbi:predicted protein [Naegleria gruberi]|uniref:Predicted protein n=1 Tax=Naegleria gruberi TaxID=5762 RepID=D2VT49_NAEGR|nr:uncharacterized protein NAEGRDRAFT_72173 [Naegleria gruberi]EFC40022.1 predicted protein [Naegleria gruberi]|eukprot:XP_002672766.1 predicted protein [Naegleria gruberi strain NEG-M]